MAEAEARTMSDLAERCRKNGVPIDEVSAGATPPARFSMRAAGFTEYRPGNYVYFDRTQVALGAGDERRLRAHGAGDGREQAGGGSRHPRQRQQDTDE